MLKHLLNIGVSDSLDFYQKRETRSLNLFASLTATGALAGTLTNLVLGEALLAYIVFSEMLSCLAALFLNYKKQFNAAPYIYIIGLNITLFFCNIYYGEAAGNYIYYFPNIICIALLHNPNRGKQRDIIFFSVVVASFVFSTLPALDFATRLELTAEQTRAMFNFNLYLGIVFTAIMMYLVIRLINRQYSELTSLLKQSETDKQTIESSLHEKEVLLAEIQHRVKNNLAVLIGLFNLQKSNTENEETRHAIREAKNRVLSIAMVHEKLYRRDNLSRINLKNYISELTVEIIKSHPLASVVKVEEELEEIMADITKAVPIGLIVNEALTNSLKHAFADPGPTPLIRVSLTTHFGVISIKISDNGKGFPESPKKNESSLGLTLIESLADQIDGEVRYSNNDGAIVKLTLPV